MLVRKISPLEHPSHNTFYKCIASGFYRLVTRIAGRFLLDFKLCAIPSAILS